MTTGAMTGKQRCALEAMEAARERGVSLTEYARTQGLAVREIYDALAALRRRGVLPKPSRKAHSRFVAVRVAPPAAATMGAEAVPAHSQVRCRIVQASGCVIECLQWPAPGWVAALSAAPGSADVAA